MSEVRQPATRAAWEQTANKRPLALETATAKGPASRLPLLKALPMAQRGTPQADTLEASWRTSAFGYTPKNSKKNRVRTRVILNVDFFKKPEYFKC